MRNLQRARTHSHADIAVPTRAIVRCIFTMVVVVIFASALVVAIAMRIGVASAMIIVLSMPKL